MWEGIIKVYLKQIITCESVVLIRVAWDRATGFCVKGNKYPVSLKGRKFNDWLKNQQNVSTRT
jgi:hypothetical protein